jgi:aminoglycoside phosphotransferase (APT) family kinase protein
LTPPRRCGRIDAKQVADQLDETPTPGSGPRRGQRPPLPADPGLPALDGAFATSTCEALRERWRGRGAVSGPIAVRRVDVKYAPGRSCVVVYELRAADRACFGVAEAAGAALRLRLLEEDPALPGLAEAVGGERLLASLRRVGGPGPVAAVPVRYQPGRSCVVRYLVGEGRERRELYGKVLAAGAGRLAAVLGALATGAAPAARAPRPLAVFEDLGLVLQTAVAGESLRLALAPECPQERRARLLEAAGAALAALQLEPRLPAPPRTLADDLVELDAHLPLVERLAPGLTGVYARLLDRLRAAPSAPAAVPAHGALRADQFLVCPDGRLALLDWDGACLAEPARDLANLLAYLDWRAIRRPHEAAAITAAGDAWLRGHGALADAPAAERLELWRGACLLKIAGRCLRGLRSGEWGRLPALLDHAASRLAA